MLTSHQAQARCQALVERARAAGADAADALFAADSSQAVQVRLGALEDVERLSAEIAAGGEAYPAGVRDIARRLNEDCSAKVQTISTLTQRS